MKLTAILIGLPSRIRSEGFSNTLRSLYRRGYIRFQERRFGIHTDDVIDLSNFGITNTECKYYSATDYTNIREIMDALAIDPREHVFLDFGAGMGRAMILAAMYPFRGVLGVEISDELASIAKSNFVRSKRHLRCRRLEIVTADAATFHIPSDVTVVYFNNPFFGDILSAVLLNLRTSLELVPRNLTVICNLPESSAFESQIKCQNWLRLQKYFVLSDGRLCLVFSAVPTFGVHAET